MIYIVCILYCLTISLVRLYWYFSAPVCIMFMSKELWFLLYRGILWWYLPGHLAKTIFTHKLSRVSKSLTALFCMRHLTYGTNFLHLFAFLVSRPPQSALLHRQTLTLLLNRWLVCLTGSSILVLKLTFSPNPFPRNLPLPLTDWFHGFYPARVRKSLALKILVSAAD